MFVLFIEEDFDFLKVLLLHCLWTYRVFSIAAYVPLNYSLRTIGLSPKTFPDFCCFKPSKFVCNGFRHFLFLFPKGIGNWNLRNVCPFYFDYQCNWHFFKDCSLLCGSYCAKPELRAFYRHGFVKEFSSSCGLYIQSCQSYLSLLFPNSSFNLNVVGFIVQKYLMFI